MSEQLGSRRAVVDVDGDHDRYHRQSLITWWDQERLRNASILVVGAGALGNELVKNLVLMGIGRILIVDMDDVENSNLARCVFFRPEDEGRPKAQVLARRAGEMNQETEIIPLVGDVRMTVGLGVFAEVDLVLGGLDNREARLFVNQACWKTGDSVDRRCDRGLDGRGPCVHATRQRLLRVHARRARPRADRRQAHLRDVDPRGDALRQNADDRDHLERDRRHASSRGRQAAALRASGSSDTRRRWVSVCRPEP